MSDVDVGIQRTVVLDKEGQMPPLRSSAARAARFLRFGVIYLTLILALLPGCDSSVLSPAPMSTPTPVIPTDTPIPSLTPIPPTMTFTPAPTRISMSGTLSIADDPTATWTPVPGNPSWSVWSYQDVTFLLPVAWQRVTEGPAGGSLYMAPGGSEQPQMLVSLERVSTGVGSLSYAEAKLELARSSLGASEILNTRSVDMDEVQAVRYAYRSPVSGKGDPGRHVRVVAFYAVKDGLAASLHFTVDEQIFEQWVDTFDKIAAGMSIDAGNEN